jgi:hypothetical protein
MLKRFVPDPMTLCAAQAVGAALFALIVAYLHGGRKLSLGYHLSRLRRCFPAIRSTSDFLMGDKN